MVGRRTISKTPMRIDESITSAQLESNFTHSNTLALNRSPIRLKWKFITKKLFQPVIETFDNRIADGELWELHHPVQASVGVGGSKIEQIRDALTAWIAASVAGLPVNRFGDRYPHSAEKESIRGVPFRFAVYRWSLPRCALSGRILRRQFIKGELEKERLSRLEQACKDKFPKLAKWKRNGARGVLVLEENDISFTNPQLVYEAMVRAEAGRSDAPDEIYLVSTFCPNPWWVTCLRREGKTYYDDGERYHELDPLTLTQVTKR